MRIVSCSSLLRNFLETEAFFFFSGIDLHRNFVLRYDISIKTAKFRNSRIYRQSPLRTFIKSSFGNKASAFIISHILHENENIKRPFDCIWCTKLSASTEKLNCYCKENFLCLSRGCLLVDIIKVLVMRPSHLYLVANNTCLVT